VKKVLILTAGFGDGHNTAARNVADALELISDDVKVETLDLFQSSLGLLNDVLKKAYLGLARYAPSVWSGIYSMIDNPSFDRVLSVGNLKTALEQAITEGCPDCVISTYPVYAHLMQEIYRDHSERPFRFITVITDSISVNSAWFRAPSDVYCVPNEETAEVLRRHGVAAAKIKAFGFPVNPLFAEMEGQPSPSDDFVKPCKLLYIINTGKKKAGKAMDRLLEIPDVELTITVGRDAELKEKLAKRTEKYDERVKVLGWTNQMPRLMASHHLVITKAGGATVQEAIAGRCPMILNQVIPGQEDGNARLVEQLDVGEVAEKNRDVAQAVTKAFAKDGKIWRQWKKNLTRLAKPDASLRIAELALAECDHEDSRRKKPKLFQTDRPAITAPAVVRTSSDARMLLCDFHIHTNYSDGKLTVPEVIDFYGKRGFDCICITDHLGDPRRLIGKLSKLLSLTLGPEQLQEYFDVIERERRRALRKYGMLVMTGIEFNKDGYTKKTSAHLLGIDLKAPINPALDLPETIAEIHAQEGLAVASHPHIMKSEWGKNTLFLWENQDVFAPLIDAWEIANRNNIFTPVGLKRLAFLANSDFHKPKHIYSWKTLLHCEKSPEAIKDCIRRNEHVAITLYRDLETTQALHRPDAEVVVQFDTALGNRREFPQIGAFAEQLRQETV
jgi:UDP-N-acetylglucosamine:LPS N-acetylglucosamine transferase/predicted metal-dependent phosphoesterase TrpH